MTSLGKGVQGISPMQFNNNKRSSGDVMIRKVVVKSWNTQYATGTVNGYGRRTGGFKAVNNIEDFLSRSNYTCGGSQPADAMKTGLKSRFGSIMSSCDNTGIPASTTNVKYIPDSSDYITYRKQKSINQNYNDLSFGGDEHHASYPIWLAVKRY